MKATLILSLTIDFPPDISADTLHRCYIASDGDSHIIIDSKDKTQIKGFKLLKVSYSIETQEK